MDASLSDDSEDFEDEEMEAQEDGKANEEKTEEEAKDQTIHDAKQNGEDSDVGKSEMDGRKLAEKKKEKVNDDKDQEELDEKTKDVHMNGKKTATEPATSLQINWSYLKSTIKDIYDQKN